MSKPGGLSILSRGPISWKPLSLPNLQKVQMEGAYLRARDRLGDVPLNTPSPYDLQETLQVITSLWNQQRSLDGVDRKHFPRIPYVLFPAEEPSPLGLDAEFVRKYLFLVGKQRRPYRVVRTLLHIFLLVYPRSTPAFETWRQGLKRLLDNVSSVFLDSWRERCNRYSYLEDIGPTRFARLWMDAPSSAALLQEAGLTGELSLGKFVRASFLQSLKEIESRLTVGSFNGDQFQRILTLLSSDVSPKEVRFADLKGKVAEALLLPFLDPTNVPPKVIQTSAMRYLLDQLGDLRVRPWVGVDPQAQQVMRRWLVGHTLDRFFDLLDATAFGYQWEYRRAFWTAYLNRDLIHAAWMVLGREPARLAPQYLEPEARRYGLLRAAQSDQSVLLMELGNLVIAEWSHNGSCRMWVDGDPTAPKLHHRRYHRDELTMSAFASIRHSGSDRASWQYKVADVIHQHTGVKLAYSDFMPISRDT